MANTFYEVPVQNGKTQLVYAFLDEEKQTLDTLDGVWIFWKVPQIDRRDTNVLYYAWKSTWPKECRIIGRDFATFFNEIVEHEEQEGFSTKSASEIHGQFVPVSRSNEEISSSIPQSQFSKDPAFEVEGEPDEVDNDSISDQELINYMHPTWPGFETEAKEETPITKSRYELMMEELSKGKIKPFGGTN